MGELRFTGRPAAPGLGIGTLLRLADRPGRRRPSGDATGEAAALRGAIDAAIAHIRGLIASAQGDAAEILGFQVAMLEDPALSESAFAAIAEGTSADQAWHDALEAEIAGYEAGGDEYLAARAGDLRDIRDAVLAALSGAAQDGTPPGAILLAEDLTPSRFLSVDWARGGAIALVRGSPTAHVAMLARARGVPMVVGLGELPLMEGASALVDGDGGTLVIAPEAATRAAFEARAAGREAARQAAAPFRLRPAVTADGTPVKVLVNVGDPNEMDGLDSAICDGVGLVRTEFLFHGGGALPDEETQYRAYRRILHWAAGRPVVLRTLDAGGDKPIPGLTIAGETNPFLGVRGIRLSLARPEVFRVQLRAMARVAAEGPVRVMLPMVAAPAEIAAAAALLDAEVAALRRAGVACARPPLGMMVEIPAAALGAPRFPVDFYSIGSNDLTQYAMAAARDIEAVAALNDPAHPAILELIARTVAAGRERGVEVSLCGDAAGDAALVPALLATGLRALSMHPKAVAEVKQAIAAQSLPAAP